MNKNQAEKILNVIRTDLKNEEIGSVLFETKEVASALKVVLQEAFYYQEEIKVSVKHENILLKTQYLNFEYSYSKTACDVYMSVTIGPIMMDLCSDCFSIKNNTMNALIQKIQAFLVKAEPLLKLEEEKTTLKQTLSQKRKELADQVANSHMEIREKLNAQINKNGIYQIEINNLNEEQFKALFNKINT